LQSKALLRRLERKKARQWNPERRWYRINPKNIKSKG
jgi:hypothetical protein